MKKICIMIALMMAVSSFAKEGKPSPLSAQKRKPAATNLLPELLQTPKQMLSATSNNGSSIFKFKSILAAGVANNEGIISGVLDSGDQAHLIVSIACAQSAATAMTNKSRFFAFGYFARSAVWQVVQGAEYCAAMATWD